MCRYKRTCAECGEAFESADTKAEFCCTAHRQAFNNRRIQRGGELYDLFMACRYDRDLARTWRAMTMLYRMAQEFRAQDVAERQGRKSWRHPKRILERHPHLQAVATDIRPRARRS